MSDDYPTPIVTTDIVVLTLKEGALQLLLAQRAADSPVAPGAWTLPGGFVHTDEDHALEDTVRRVFRSKTGGDVAYLEQLCTFGSADRDPRGWSLSVAYLALVPEHKVTGLDAQRTRWVTVRPCPSLPFDHTAIVAQALDRVRGKAAYSSLPAFLLPDTFTLPELMAVYEAVLNQQLDQSTFRRKVAEQRMIVRARGARVHEGAGRPAALYKLSRPALQDFGRVLLGTRDA
ncbi:NUDIX hydrolase [Dyella sp.]|uniref:NUDIX hydrolase n=1 Tax=Dyella sp. TaxID=1869338 RepID=UPI002ED29619